MQARQSRRFYTSRPVALNLTNPARLLCHEPLFREEVERLTCHSRRARESDVYRYGISERVASRSALFADSLAPTDRCFSHRLGEIEEIMPYVDDRITLNTDTGKYMVFNADDPRIYEREATVSEIEEYKKNQRKWLDDLFERADKLTLTPKGSINS